MNPDELESQGWTRQFTTELLRLPEYVELYQALGQQVHTEPVTRDLMSFEACTTCLLAACDRYVIIYTRPKASA